ncbi:MAG: polyamine aminopropyltransferase [Acidiferrobacterales bacterium]
MSIDELTPGKWYTEISTESGSAFSLKIRKKIHQEQTPYQLLEIYDTEVFGKLMTLDGLVMLCGLDNFIYHEMMTHTALFTHPRPKRVAIIGGGDCGCLKEVLKHPEVESAELVELDERVTRVSEKYFPELCESNSNPRAHFKFGDGIKHIHEADNGSYDVIVVDSTDPVGPAVGLFSQEFYSDCLQALSPDGVLIVQSESPLFHMEIITSVKSNMKNAGFTHVATLDFPQCSYPSGWWSATLASKSIAPGSFRRPDTSIGIENTRYYNSEIHAAALAKPPFMKQVLGN